MAAWPRVLTSLSVDLSACTCRAMDAPGGLTCNWWAALNFHTHICIIFTVVTFYWEPAQERICICFGVDAVGNLCLNSGCVQADAGKGGKGVTANTQQDTDKMVDNSGNLVALNPRKRINFKLIEKEVNTQPHLHTKHLEYRTSIY